MPLDRTFIFWLQIAYLGGLAVLAVLFFTDDINPRSTVGTIPTAVPWFGALGGVLISLKGVFDHPYDWSPGYRLWHISRPFISATVAVIAILIFQSGILAVGSDPEVEDVTRPTNLFYYLIAFLVGYREETFRELIKRLVDVVLTPGDTTPVVVTIRGLDPEKGPISGGTEVTLIGSNFTDTRLVKFGSVDATFTVLDDSHLVARTPPAETPGTVTVTVSGLRGSASAPASFTYDGGSPSPGPLSGNDG